MSFMLITVQQSSRSPHSLKLGNSFFPANDPGNHADVVWDSHEDEDEDEDVEDEEDDDDDYADDDDDDEKEE